jgi:protein-S-isoprenylcysteine O-methyltransferase Ste14
MFKHLVFFMLSAAELLLIASFILTLLSHSFRVWPPPSRRSWQFYFVWGLVDFCYIGYITLGILDWNSSLLDHWLRFPVGAVLMAAGMSLAIWGLRELSYTVSLGLGGEFTTSGPYRYSRNPQYVGFMILIAGYALVSNSWRTLIAGFMGALLFSLAPFLEEPWLEERYGRSYRAYKESVPRFIGFPRP